MAWRIILYDDGPLQGITRDESAKWPWLKDKCLQKRQQIDQWSYTPASHISPLQFHYFKYDPWDSLLGGYGGKQLTGFHLNNTFTPLLLLSCCGSKKSCLTSTSILELWKSSCFSNRRKTVARVRFNSARARLKVYISVFHHTNQGFQKIECKICNGTRADTLHSNTLPWTLRKRDQVSLEWRWSFGTFLKPALRSKFQGLGEY